MTERRPWTKQEDQTLKYLKQERKMRKWSEIAQKMAVQFGLSGRNQKQCRQRYHNHLDQKITFQQLTDKEEEILFQSHDQIGNKWSLIAMRFQGRTDNYLKNHFYSKLRSSIRRINRLIKENWKKNSSTFSLNIVYKIVEISDHNFQLDEDISQNGQFFLTLKNEILQFGGAKLIKDYFKFIHEDDQMEYLISRLKKFEKVYALIKKRQLKKKDQGELQSQHTMSKSFSEKEQQSKILFKVFQHDQDQQNKENKNSIRSKTSEYLMNSNDNSINKIEPELQLQKIEFFKNQSIVEIFEQNFCQDKNQSLMKDLLKDEEIKFPIFGNRMSNY